MLKRAFTMGLDPAGNRLHIAMPHYRLTHEEAAGLISYIQRLGQIPDPGVEEKSVRLGVLQVHGAGPAGVAVRRILEAAADDLAAAGGVYGRRPELRFLTLPATPEDHRSAVAQFLQREEIFALVASELPNQRTLNDTLSDSLSDPLSRPGILDLLLKTKVPLVGAFGIDPPDTSLPNPFVFYLHAGPQQLARALVSFAVGQLPRPPQRAIVIYPPQAQQEATALRRQGKQHHGSWVNIEELVYPGEQPLTPEQAIAAREADTEAVFFLGPTPHAISFLTTAEAIGWSPNIFMLGPRAGALLGTAPPLAHQSFLAFASRPADTTREGFARYRQTAKEMIKKRATQDDLSNEHLRDQLRALAAFDLLIAGLEEAGRQLDRGRLISALENLDRHITGLTPPLSFGPNRRVGALGAWIVPMVAGRQAMIGEATWIPLAPL
jgi:ABC-type branched-subunit amino acid transport system substrate-binding protein